VGYTDIIKSISFRKKEFKKRVCARKEKNIAW
jgi:hypothetical protein